MMKWMLLVMLLAVIPTPGSAETLVVLNKAEGTASLIDLKTGSIRATVPTGQGPHEAATSPDGKWVLVTNYGTREAPGSTLSLIDATAGKVTETIDLDPYGKPHGVVWLKDGRSALVTAEAQKVLLVVDVMEGKVKQAIPTGQDVSHMVVATPDEKRAFVANIGSGSITVLDLVEGRAVTNISTGDGAEGLDITPDGTQLWVTNRAVDSISVIDPESLKIISTVPSRSFPIRAKVTPDGKHVLVSNARSGEVVVFSTDSKKEIQRIKIPLEAEGSEGRLFGDQFGESSVPIGIVIHPDGNKAYVANANADAVSVIDLKSWTVTGNLKAGKEPDGMAYSSR
jgi:YVTN family beta-propeller protein